MEDRQHEGGVSSVLYNITSPDKEPRVHYWIQNMCIFRAVRAFLTKWKLAIPFVVCSRSETKQPIECQQKANWVRRTRHGRAGREKLSSEQEQQLYGPSCCGLRMPISRCYSFSKEVRTLEILNKKKSLGFLLIQNCLTLGFCEQRKQSEDNQFGSSANVCGARVSPCALHIQYSIHLARMLPEDNSYNMKDNNRDSFCWLCHVPS